MVLKLISSKVGKIEINEIDPVSFPELHTFHNWSLASASAGVSYGDSQHPFAILHSCSQVNSSEIFSIKGQGKTFEVLSPGAHVTDTSLASDWYPTHLPDPKPNLLLAMVHSCTRAAICRELLDSESHTTLRKIKEREIDSKSWLEREGLSRIELQMDEKISESDLMHAYTRALRIIARSDEIRHVVSEGNLMIFEAYYDNKTGKVSWPAYWTSSSKAIDKKDVEAVLNWHVPGSMKDLSDQMDNIKKVIRGRKALEDVLTLVVGNTQHVLSRIQGEKKIFSADYVVLGCSDSRAGSQMLYSPEGRVEWIRTAGHAIDNTTLRGLRIACFSAVKNIKDGLCGHESHVTQQGQPRRAVLYVLGHTQCGAVKATLENLLTEHTEGSTSKKANSPVRPLLKSLTGRFISKDSQALLKDPQQIMAAEINSIETVKEILESSNPEAKKIQKLVQEGSLLVVPAVYYTSTGVINQLIDSEVFKQQIQIDIQPAAFNS